MQRKEMIQLIIFLIVFEIPKYIYCQNSCLPIQQDAYNLPKITGLRPCHRPIRPITQLKNPNIADPFTMTVVRFQNPKLIGKILKNLWPAILTYTLGLKLKNKHIFVLQISIWLKIPIIKTKLSQEHLLIPIKKIYSIVLGQIMSRYLIINRLAKSKNSGSNPPKLTIRPMHKNKKLFLHHYWLRKQSLSFENH